MNEKTTKKFVNVEGLRHYDEKATTKVDTQINEKMATKFGAQTVQRNTVVSGNDSTVTITKTTGNMISNTSNDEEIALPVASETMAGVMNPATFIAVKNCSETLDTMLNGSVSIADLAANPTQQALTDAWKAATGKTAVINGAKIDDSANNKIWTYYANINGWRSAAIGEASVSISVWTNETAGTVLGSNTDGQVFAEADGTGSVNGWDAVKESITNNTSALGERYTKTEADAKFIAQTDLVALSDDAIHAIINETEAQE